MYKYGYNQIVMFKCTELNSCKQLLISFLLLTKLENITDLDLKAW